MRTINVLKRKQVGGTLLVFAFAIIVVLMFMSKIKEQKEEIKKLREGKEYLTEELDEEKDKSKKLTTNIKEEKDKNEALQKEKQELEEKNEELEEEKNKLINTNKSLEKKLQEKKPPTVSRGSNRARTTTNKGNKRLLGTFEVTAYTDDVESQGKWVGKTASGMKPQVGVVAVDPKVIPLGTKLFVEGYGECIAGDTGGAIKGNIIDVFFNTKQECRSWGRKKKKVYIIE